MSRFRGMLVGLMLVLGAVMVQAEGAGPWWSELPPATGGRSELGSFAELVRKCRAGVVAVEVELEAPLMGIGSAVVLRADGLLLTNHHVVERARRIWIRAEGADRLLAKLKGVDPRSDLALLQVQPLQPLTPLPLGDSDALAVGAWVIALGHPFGLSHVATKGIVSGKGRSLEDLHGVRSGYFDFIQTDALVQHGNSGGALINLRGEVVGINTATNRRARGISFAVPINVVKAVVPHLAVHGQVVRGYLGIGVGDLSWAQARELGMEAPKGVLITRVRSGTPAEAAHIRPGDVILRLNDASIRRRSDLSWRVGTWPAGKPLRLDLLRDGEILEVLVTPKKKQD
ncbi:MAG: trypsin-like peptidase domain-containing protein [Deltaproteobacteria bacterium]|nr:trypsin-like peptidase domain-containing protein [Deltaproteobacteria bacterium]